MCITAKDTMVVIEILSKKKTRKQHSKENQPVQPKNNANQTSTGRELRHIARLPKIIRNVHELAILLLEPESTTSVRR